MAFTTPRKRYNAPSVTYLPAPVGGWAPDVPPSELPENQAPVFDNWLVRPGRVASRGPFSVWADLSALPPLNVCGVQPHLGDSNLFISRKVASSSAYIDPWNAPIVRPLAGAAIAAPNLTVQIAQGGTTLGTVATTANKVPGPRGINYEGTRYYLGYGGTPVADAGGTYFAQANSLCTLTSASTLTEFTNAPHGAVDLKGYQERIWLLSGIDTPGALAPFNPLNLFFTNAPLAAGGGSASADWKDTVTGLTNKIQMDGDYTDPGVGLATVRNALVIFRYSSIWALRGTTTQSYSVQPVSREVGCIDNRSIVECDRGVYFLSHKGLMLTDGVTVRNVTGPGMTQTLQNAVGVFLTNMLSGFGGYATCARVSDGQILVSIGVPSVTSSAPDGHLQPVWCGLFNPDTGVWVRLTSAIWAADGTIVTAGNNYPGWVVNPQDKRLLTVGDKYITQLEAPAAANTQLLNATQFPTVAADDNSNGMTSAWGIAGGAVSLIDGVSAPDGKSADSSPGITSPSGSDYLKCTGYGFAVPSNATIAGIAVDILKREVTSTGEFRDLELKLLKGGAIQAANRADTSNPWVTNTFTWHTYGGASDLWGTTWTPADVNASNFGCVFSVVNSHLTSRDAQVDTIRMTVYYTVGSPSAGASFVQTTALYDKDAAGNYQPIPVKWTSKLMPGGLGGRKHAKLQSIFLDYVFQESAPQANHGWTVQPVNESGASVGSGFSTPTGSGFASSSVTGGTQKAAATVQRITKDNHFEFTDAGFTVSWADMQRASSDGTVVAEIYGVGCVSQPTNDLT